MNKILKILSILIVGFVMFSCSIPTNDPTVFPVEETPEEPTYSITFIAYTEKEDTATEAVRTFLNSLPDYKNLKEGEEVKLPTKVYFTEDGKLTLNKTDEYLDIIYEDTITSVVVGNKSIMIKFRIQFNSDN